MAVAPDEAAAARADETLRHLLAGKYEAPVVNVITITKEEFRRTAPMAQSQAGQAARHGVTPDGRSLEYQPEREPEPEEIREAAIFWLVLAEIHLESFSLTSDNQRLTRSHIPAFEAQTALERAFKALLTAGNGGARFRRDAALMWRHMESTCPITDRKGALSMEALLAATAGPDGQGCSLTRLTEAWRRGDIVPDPREQEMKALSLHLVPAVNALIEEALARAGVARDNMQQERNRRRGPSR